MLHGCGSVAGATLGAAAMSTFGPPALFHYIAGVYAIFAAVCLWRMVQRAPAAAKAPFAPTPTTASPAVFDIATQPGAVPGGDREAAKAHETMDAAETLSR
jgi:uncharacterized membrane protein YfcA